ncbi:PilZ domain-containing protein [uncultured Erythrobacter sp.]|uniref:PilZ domain-containing protein n=1 Tax=uncultured Erythrobacter sp. TaxID=263913 RepID=UPI0026204FD3|nr:PilZ domain-containing protein [uncultured Erythrobacter sp.]
MNVQSVPRTSNRRPLSLVVKSRVQSRVIYVDLIDISEGGCKIKATRGFANVGDRVTMKLGNIHAPLGRIAWVQDRFAGVAFEGEIHSAVLDHMCTENEANLQCEPQRTYRV